VVLLPLGSPAPNAKSENCKTNSVKSFKLKVLVSPHEHFFVVGTGRAFDQLQATRNLLEQRVALAALGSPNSKAKGGNCKTNSVKPFKLKVLVTRLTTRYQYAEYSICGISAEDNVLDRSTWGM